MLVEQISNGDHQTIIKQWAKLGYITERSSFFVAEARVINTGTITVNHN